MAAQNILISRYGCLIHSKSQIKEHLILSSLGKEHNFKTRDDTESSALGVPYDYGSVMHYSKTSFNIGSEPTIITKIPQFMDVIGQRIGFSANDLTKLNLLYNCSESSAI